jgi:hypothetical protein
MSEEESTVTDDIPLDGEDTDIFTAYEPDFSRVFARGTLLRISEDDPDTLQVGFWTERDQDIELEDGGTGTGYRLESEAVMTWRTARRLRQLLDKYIDEHAPEEYQISESPEE